MIELNTFSLLGADVSLQATGAVAQITGVAFVAVKNRHGDPLNIGQSLVAFQPLVDVMNPLSKPFGIHQRMDAPDRVGTACRLFQPALPEAWRDRIPA